MWKTVWLAASLTLSVGCSTLSPVVADSGGDPLRMNMCHRVGFDRYSYDTPTAIPDGDPAGVVLGPLRIQQESSRLSGVVVCLNVTHSYTGDLDARLYYDADNDGKPDAVVPLEFYRLRTDGCTADEASAYPISLDGAYFFRDDATPSPAVEGQTAVATAAQPLASEEIASLSVLDRLPRGGSFYLAVVDSLPQETGTIKSWTVYTKRIAPGFRNMGL